MSVYDLYTSVHQRGNTIFYRGYDSQNRRISKRVNYRPYLFIRSKSNEGEFSSMERSPKPLDKIEFDSIKEAKDFIQQYKDVAGFEIHGMYQFVYPFLNDFHPSEINYRKDRINVCKLDIEVDSEGHFATPENPDQSIVSISVLKEHLGQKTKYIFTLHPWENSPEDVIVIQCKDEYALLTKFVDMWQQWDFDIVTGWYLDLFDIPYLVERMKIVLGQELTLKLSPWGMIEEGERTNKMGQKSKVYDIIGIECLDYLRLYEKFTYTKHESYSLNAILEHLKLPLKIEYEGSLADLYKNDKPKFYEYNVGDTDGVDNIDAKTNLLDQALTIAYDARIPLQDVFGTVKMWDQIVHCTLMDRKIAIPPMVHRGKGEQYAGAYVKEPRQGKHKWLVSLDFASLYPSLIVWGNFSPETARGRLSDFCSVDDLLAWQLSHTVKEYLKKNNVALAANMTVWDKSVLGIFPELCIKYMKDRKVYKKKMLEAKSEKERLKAAGELTKEKERELEFEIARCNNMQMARKIQINSLYGAIGNAFFRYFSVDFAEAITLSGQLAAQWTETRLNEYLNKIFETEGYEYVVYADTDSNYVTLDPIVRKVFGDNPADVQKVIAFMDKVVEQKIQPFINKTLGQLAEYMNAYNGGALDMKREALADTGIWTGKKYYVMSVYDNEGVKYAEPDLKIMGLAAVKSSTPKFCRGKIKDAIKLMLWGAESDLIKFVSETKQEFGSLPFHEFASPSGCNGLKKYEDRQTIYKKGTPAHVKGALIFNSILRTKGLDKQIVPIKDGDKVKYAYLKTPNPFFQDVISAPGKLPPELKIDDYLDRDAAFEKSFISPVKSVADAIGWQLEQKGNLNALWDD